MILYIFIASHLLQVIVCLCSRDTCNGLSLPPREMIEQAHEAIDFNEVLKGLQEQQEQVVQPEPVSSLGVRTIVNSNLVISPVIVATFFVSKSELLFGLG